MLLKHLITLQTHLHTVPDLLFLEPTVLRHPSLQHIFQIKVKVLPIEHYPFAHKVLAITVVDFDESVHAEERLALVVLDAAENGVNRGGFAFDFEDVAHGQVAHTVDLAFADVGVVDCGVELERVLLVERARGEERGTHNG